MKISILVGQSSEDILQNEIPHFYLLDLSISSIEESKVSQEYLEKD